MVLQEILVSAFCVATSHVKNCMRDIISVRDNERGGGFSACTRKYQRYTHTAFMASPPPPPAPKEHL